MQHFDSVGCCLILLHTYLSYIWAACRHPRSLDLALSVTRNPCSLLIRGVTRKSLSLREITWIIAKRDRRLCLASVWVCLYLRSFMVLTWPHILHRWVVVLRWKAITIEESGGEKTLLHLLSYLKKTGYLNSQKEGYLSPRLLLFRGLIPHISMSLSCHPKWRLSVLTPCMLPPVWSFFMIFDSSHCSQLYAQLWASANDQGGLSCDTGSSLWLWLVPNRCSFSAK